MITDLATTFVPDHHPTTPSTRRPAATTSSSQPSSRCFLTEGARPSFRRSVRSGGGLHRLRSHHRPWWWTSDAAGRLAASMWRPSSTNDSGSMAMWTRVPYKARFEFSHFAELTETVQLSGLPTPAKKKGCHLCRFGVRRDKAVRTDTPIPGKGKGLKTMGSVISYYRCT